MEQFKYAQFEKFKLSTSSPNNCCMLHDGSIVLAKNFLLSPQTSKKYVVCEVFNEAIDFYSAPCPSSLLGIYKVDELSLTTQTRDVSDIKQKMVYISINNVQCCSSFIAFQLSLLFTRLCFYFMGASHSQLFYCTNLNFRLTLKM